MARGKSEAGFGSGWPWGPFYAFTSFSTVFGDLPLMLSLLNPLIPRMIVYRCCWSMVQREIVQGRRCHLHSVIPHTLDKPLPEPVTKAVQAVASVTGSISALLITDSSAHAAHTSWPTFSIQLPSWLTLESQSLRRRRMLSICFMSRTLGWTQLMWATSST